MQVNAHRMGPDLLDVGPRHAHDPLVDTGAAGLLDGHGHVIGRHRTEQLARVGRDLDRQRDRGDGQQGGLDLVGVLTVGVVSLIVPDLFPSTSVWSTFGSGYLFIPLVLPIVGLWWLRRTRPA